MDSWLCILHSDNKWSNRFWEWNRKLWGNTFNWVDTRKWLIDNRHEVIALHCDSSIQMCVESLRFHSFQPDFEIAAKMFRKNLHQSTGARAARMIHSFMNEDKLIHRSALTWLVDFNRVELCIYENHEPFVSHQNRFGGLRENCANAMRAKRKVAPLKRRAYNFIPPTKSWKSKSIAHRNCVCACATSIVLIRLYHFAYAIITQYWIT